MTRAIRIDPEVHARLVAERRPEERNFNAAIQRMLKRHKAITGRSDIDPEIQKHMRRWL